MVPAFVCAKNFVALTGQASNSSYVTQGIVTALFRAVLFGEPSDFAPYIGKKLLSALRKYQDLKSVNARNNNKLPFDMMPVLLAIVHEVWPGAIVAEEVHPLKVPDSDTLAIFKADSSILGEYEEIGPHVQGEYLERFTQWREFERRKYGRIIHHHRKDPRVDGKGRHVVPMNNKCVPIVQEEGHEDEQRPSGQTTPGEGATTP
ncbi:hypothetical protein R1sor_003182 [Riccia sorocarpa]|uniref:Uncharacterized protein n=1 Tax=Riccia sorocarpa TaxID=122646 RepID=A0ABD3H477_9MARC